LARKGLKVLHLVRQFLPSRGGMELYVYHLCEELMRIGHEVTVLTLDQNLRTGERFQQSEKISTKFGEIDLLRTSFQKFGPLFYVPLKKLENACEGVDLIHVHGCDQFLEELAFLRLMSRVKAPCVMSTHGGFFHTRKYFLIKKFWFSTLTNWSLSKMDGVLACSKSDFFKFKEICNDVELVENGVALEDLLYSPGPIEGGCGLYIGGFHPHKSVRRLVELFSFLHKNCGLKELHLVGVGEELEDCTNLVKQRGLQEHIHFHQDLSREELAKLYEKSALFFSASTFEGFGLSIVEAIASGCALLLQRNDAFVSLLGDQDPALCDYRELLQELKQNESSDRFRERLTQSSSEEMLQHRAKIAQRFDWRKVSQDLENLYLNLASIDIQD